MCADRFDYTARYWGIGGNDEFVREVVDAVTAANGVIVFRSLKAARDFGYMHMRMFIEGAHDSRAERAMRPIVIKRRVGQQTRGDDNMDSYAMQMSLYETSKLRGQDYIETLTDMLKSSVLPRP